jgi:hypothetical protein
VLPADQFDAVKKEVNSPGSEPRIYAIHGPDSWGEIEDNLTLAEAEKLIEYYAEDDFLATIEKENEELVSGGYTEEDEEFKELAEKFRKYKELGYIWGMERDKYIQQYSLYNTGTEEYVSE